MQYIHTYRLTSPSHNLSFPRKCYYYFSFWMRANAQVLWINQKNSLQRLLKILYVYCIRHSIPKSMTLAMLLKWKCGITMNKMIKAFSLNCWRGFQRPLTSCVSCSTLSINFIHTCIELLAYGKQQYGFAVRMLVLGVLAPFNLYSSILHWPIIVQRDNVWYEQRILQVPSTTTITNNSDCLMVSARCAFNQ